MTTTLSPPPRQTGRSVRVKPPGQTGVMMLRPRAWCMTEFHLHVNGRAVPGPLVDFGWVRRRTKQPQPTVHSSAQHSQRQPRRTPTDCSHAPPPTDRDTEPNLPTGWMQPPDLPLREGAGAAGHGPLLLLLQGGGLPRGPPLERRLHVGRVEAGPHEGGCQGMRGMECLCRPFTVPPVAFSDQRAPDLDATPTPRHRTGSRPAC